MTNENNNLIKEETGLNRKFFEGLIEAGNLSLESKKYIGEFKDFKNDTVGEVLKVGDKEKIAAYDKLNIKELPGDWEFKLAREKELEKILVENEPKIEAWKDWTDTFGEKKPEEVKEFINLLEEKNKEIGEELITEKEKHALTENSLKEWEQAFPNQTPLKLQEKVQELEVRIKEWTQFFDYRELEEIKQEIKKLQQRPDIPIDKDRFWDDFAQRKSLEQSELERKELEEEKKKVAKLEQEREHFLQATNRILKNERIRRYTFSKPVLTFDKAREAIAELLAETEESWKDYLDKRMVTNQNFVLELSLRGEMEKETQAQQILKWIEKARDTLDYEKLFEQWNGSKKYNEEWDFDGGLYLLSEWLKVKDSEILINEK